MWVNYNLADNKNLSSRYIFFEIQWLLRMTAGLHLGLIVIYSILRFFGKNDRILKMIRKLKNMTSFYPLQYKRITLLFVHWEQG